MIAADQHTKKGIIVIPRSKDALPTKIILARVTIHPRKGITRTQHTERDAAEIAAEEVAAEAAADDGHHNTK
eukprot:12431546-Karenia_brevis.AAC.1